MNLTVLIGRITKDLELKKTKNGKSVLNFSIAVPRKFNRDETDFFDVTVWDKAAENLVKYQGKGSLIGVEGELQQQRWDDNGQKRSKVIINASNIEYLDSKKQEEPSTQYNEPVPAQEEPAVDITSDDLPF